MKRSQLFGLLIFGVSGAAVAQSSVISSSAPASQGGLVETVVGVDQRFRIKTDSLLSASSLEGVARGVNFKTDSVVKVEVTGFASIDGATDLNNQLSKQRAEKIKEALMRFYGIPASKIKTGYRGEDWDFFKKLVEADAKIPGREEVLDIISSTAGYDEKEFKIRNLNNGATWKYLDSYVFPEMRSASVVWTVMTPPAEPEPPVPPRRVIIVDEEPLESVVEEVVQVEEIEELAAPADDWCPKMYIKTNAPAWALFWQNLALEVDMARHWSFSLPVYWSPYNYGKQTLKFRTLTFMPEFRYWPRPDNMGFFVNAHFGASYFNVAFNGEHRYQNHPKKRPALGGGAGIGYRFYFCRNHHWSMEVALGGGVYHLDYDIFENTPSTKDGYLIGRRKRTFYCLDQAALTFSYSFGLKKKK